MTEVELLSGLRHPNVIEYLNCYETRNHLWVIFEYCAGGDLLRLLKQDSRLPEDRVRIFGRQICAGLLHIHSRPEAKSLRPGSPCRSGEQLRPQRPGAPTWHSAVYGTRALLRGRSSFLQLRSLVLGLRPPRALLGFTTLHRGVLSAASMSGDGCCGAQDARGYSRIPGPDLRAPPAPAATFGLAAAAGASLVARGAPGGGQ